MKRTHPRYKSRKQRRNRKRTTQKFASCTTKPKQNIVETFLGILNDVKLYHWNTHSFSQHKATDELHERLSVNIDKFVEVLLGKHQDRIDQFTKNLPVRNDRTSRNFEKTMYEFREYLINMEKCLKSKELNPSEHQDLLNIRDEILADVNQFLYLMTLK